MTYTNLVSSRFSISYLSREYGVTNVMIYKWIKEYSNVQVSDTEIMSVKEYEQWKKRITELEMEKWNPKKATDIFERKR